MSFNLKKILVGAALALSATASFAAAPLKIATVNWIGYGPFYVAEALDMYKKYGLSVKLQVFADPALIPPALVGGSVQAADGSWVKGFVCEPDALRGATDISHFGGWRAFLASK